MQKSRTLPSIELFREYWYSIYFNIIRYPTIYFNIIIHRRVCQNALGLERHGSYSKKNNIGRQKSQYRVRARIHASSAWLSLSQNFCDIENRWKSTPSFESCIPCHKTGKQNVTYKFVGNQRSQSVCYDVTFFSKSILACARARTNPSTYVLIIIRACVYGVLEKRDIVTNWI